MVQEVQARGDELTWVIGGSWYSSLENLKFLLLSMRESYHLTN